MTVFDEAQEVSLSSMDSRDVAWREQELRIKEDELKIKRDEYKLKERTTRVFSLANPIIGSLLVAFVALVGSWYSTNRTIGSSEENTRNLLDRSEEIRVKQRAESQRQEELSLLRLAVSEYVQKIIEATNMANDIAIRPALTGKRASRQEFLRYQEGVARKFVEITVASQKIHVLNPKVAFKLHPMYDALIESVGHISTLYTHQYPEVEVKPRFKLLNCKLAEIQWPTYINSILPELRSDGKMPLNLPPIASPPNCQEEYKSDLSESIKNAKSVSSRLSR